MEEVMEIDWEIRYLALKAAIIDLFDQLGDKKTAERFRWLTLGGKLQIIEAKEEIKFKEMTKL